MWSLTSTHARYLSVRLFVYVCVGMPGFIALACNFASQPESPTPAPPATSALTAPPTKDLCPLDDDPLCAFIAEIEPAIESGDIDQILLDSMVFDCGTHGIAGPGFDPSQDCGQDEFCVHLGALQGEGGCTPLSRVRAVWESNAVAPIRLRGIVYPAIPGLGLEGVELLSGPAILISTGDDVWDWILFAGEDRGGWKVSALLLQRRQAAKFQTPDEIIIPWP